MFGMKVSSARVPNRSTPRTSASVCSGLRSGAGTAFRGGRGRLPWAVAASLIAATGSLGGTARAQDSAFDGEFSVQRFAPAPGPRNLLSTRGARQDGKMTYSAGLLVNYAYRPFVVKSCVSETDCDSPNAVQPEDVLVVENLVSGDLMGSLTVIPALQLGARLPITWADGQGITPDGSPDPDQLSATGLGDMELEAKYRFLGTPTDVFALGGAAFATVPLGTLTTADGSYIGDRSPTFGLRGIGDVKVGDASVMANLVGMWRQSGRVGSTELGAEMRFGVGAGYQVAPLLQILVDGYGSTAFSGSAGTNTLEALLAARITPEKIPIAITAGGGTGVLRGVGVPMVRALLGLIYIAEPHDQDGDGLLDEKDACPVIAEDFDNFQDSDGCPDTDNDDDGIGDADDKCPDQAEDPDDFEDSDGCPDVDNDGDGLNDVNDACPNEAETKNGYKDEDGCPDEKDTDNDGIPDVRDKCPNDPEDTDGFQDEDGCSDPDNDGDTVPDSQDECGDEPETLNGFEDEDGCPDEAPKKNPWER
jgi:OOP family OmpA-OmpF porin